MKYVMFTHRTTGLRVPVFGSDHLSHDEMGPPPSRECVWVPTSAGFFTIPDMKCSGNSRSLSLMPAPDDATICKTVVLGMESMLYLVQDTGKNLTQLAKAAKKRPAMS